MPTTRNGEPLRVAVVGAGMMGTNHLRVLRDFDERYVQLVGVADTFAPSLARAVEGFGVPGYLDYREMIAETQPDLVSVVVPTQFHFDVAVHALDQGIHVLVEKPIAHSEEEAGRLIRLARARNALLAVGYLQRFNPAVIALKQQLEHGDLGHIYAVHARHLGPLPSRVSDLGVVLDVATHDLDLMRYLAGTDIIQMRAEIRRHVHPQHEDLLLGLIRFASGAAGVLDVNWLTPVLVRELAVTTERGMYVIDFSNQRLHGHEHPHSTNIPRDTPPERSVGTDAHASRRATQQQVNLLRAEYEDMFMAVRGGRPPTVSGEDGLAVLRLAHQLMDEMRAEEATSCA